VFLRRAWDHDLAWSFRRSPVTVVAALVTAVCIAAALLSPWIAPQDPFDQHVFRHVEGDHEVHSVAFLGQHFVERPGLLHGAREAIEKHAWTGL